MNYEVACVCGRALRGERHARHQVVPCPGCSRRVFVLPRSPFEVVIAPPARTAAWNTWRGPLLGAAACGVVLVAGFAVALPYLSRPAGPAEGISPKEDLPWVRQRIAAARNALVEGKVHVATKTCDDALRGRVKWPGHLTAAESRDLDQLWRQTQLLARLSPRSLEEIVRHAMLIRDPDEWLGHFADYQGKSIVFDDVLRRDADGMPVLGNHVVEVDGATVRLALEELSILRDLPLDEGPRVVFGARLSRCAREEGGVWVVRFDPDSGVLLTEVAAVEVCFPVPADEELRAILERQKAWLAER